MYRYSLSLLLTICLLAYGCGAAKDLGKTLGDLAVVRAELMKKFAREDINVRVNTFDNKTLIAVTYINSPLNEKTKEERGQRAQETANIVRQHYPAIKNVSEIWVGFMSAKTRLVVFHWSQMIETYAFDAEGRSLTAPATDNSDPSQPWVRYLPSQNQTEISGSAIQLEGTSEKGVLFVPHFSVAGDVNKSTPKPPKEVALDFAAFSDKPKFPNETKLVFLSDNEIAYQTKVQFSTSKIAGDMYSEFLYLKIPPGAFLKISSGRTVKIKLNAHEYTLTDTQLLLVQRMSDYLK